MPLRGADRRPRSLTLWTLFLLSALLPLAASGLPDDREQPIHITADKAVRDEKRGVTVYSGNVQMRQGSMELDADSLTIYHQNEDANRFVARGSPARMRQQPEIDKGLVHAHAEVITYFRDQERVHLRSTARIEREDGTLVTGDSIDYFITRELVKAESDRSDKDNKVFVVIPPSLHQGGSDTDEEAPATAGGPAQPEASAAPGSDPATGNRDEDAGLSGGTESE